MTVYRLCFFSVLTNVYSDEGYILGQWSVIMNCRQCFDTVGWASGRASGLKKLSDD